MISNGRRMPVTRWKNVLRQPHNAATLQVLLSLCDKKYFAYFASLFRQKYRLFKIYLQICENILWDYAIQKNSWAFSSK